MLLAYNLLASCSYETAISLLSLLTMIRRKGIELLAREVRRDTRPSQREPLVFSMMSVLPLPDHEMLPGYNVLVCDMEKRFLP